jgi:hypothetical protein
VPFYSWECITLNLKNRDVNLVIRDQESMDSFIFILISEMETIDGKQGSAKEFLSYLNKESYTE